MIPANIKTPPRICIISICSFNKRKARKIVKGSSKILTMEAFAPPISFIAAKRNTPAKTELTVQKNKDHLIKGKVIPSVNKNTGGTKIIMDIIEKIVV